ncbi:MAG TPA: tripartite tricarboxylate transporter substrate binding protein [Burkholderiales bacterium]|nr:tripartite tricarboxylate transporter substrate binding protein [Burkholderiales bacterium]
MKHGYAVVLALAFAMPAAPLQAQDPVQPPAWPARAVRLVVPSSPGGGTDIYARLLAQGLGDALKQQFIVENRPGASGNIGAEMAAKSAPDGYTFLVSATPALVVNPSLYRNLPYNAERDFAPVARGVINPLVFVSHPSVPVTSVPALVALARRVPGKLAYGSAGSGSTTNLGVKMIEETAGARFVHVPYKGLGQAIQGLLRGDLAFMASDIVTALPHIPSGRVVALAVTLRTPLLPGTPTLADAGYPGIEAHASFMVAAPAGTSPAIVRRLSAEIMQVMKSPAIREKLDALALIPIFDTPEEFAASLKKERARFAEIIRRNNIVAE